MTHIVKLRDSTTKVLRDLQTLWKMYYSESKTVVVATSQNRKVRQAGRAIHKHMLEKHRIMPAKENRDKVFVIGGVSEDGHDEIIGLKYLDLLATELATFDLKTLSGLFILLQMIQGSLTCAAPATQKTRLN